MENANMGIKHSPSATSPLQSAGGHGALPSPLEGAAKSLKMGILCALGCSSHPPHSPEQAISPLPSGLSFLGSIPVLTCWSAEQERAAGPGTEFTSHTKCVLAPFDVEAVSGEKRVEYEEHTWFQSHCAKI